jgi:hypothetical protein
VTPCNFIDTYRLFVVFYFLDFQGKVEAAGSTDNLLFTKWHGVMFQEPSYLNIMSLGLVELKTFYSCSSSSSIIILVLLEVSLL